MIKKTFYELIMGKIEGKWCNGIALIEIIDDSISICHIRSLYMFGEGQNIDGYGFDINEKQFSKVEEMSYAKAIKEFELNNKTIVSPIVFETIGGVRGIGRDIPYGRNVFEHTEDNKILVNNGAFDSLEEVSKFGLISPKEKKEKWLVFEE